jgi:hypothetical protein
MILLSTGGDGAKLECVDEVLLWELVM